MARHIHIHAARDSEAPVEYKGFRIQRRLSGFYGVSYLARSGKRMDFSENWRTMEEAKAFVRTQTVHDRKSRSHDARRLIDTMSNGVHAVRIYYDPDYEEYVCRLSKNGVVYEPADYFTNDKADAMSSAKDMLRRAIATKDAAQSVTLIDILNSPHRALVEAIEDTLSSLEGKKGDTRLEAVLKRQIAELKSKTGYEYKV